MGLLKLVKRIKYCPPVIIGEVILDLLGIHVRRSKPVCGGELIITRYVVTGRVKGIATLDLKKKMSRSLIAGETNLPQQLRVRVHQLDVQDHPMGVASGYHVM